MASSDNDNEALIGSPQQSYGATNTRSDSQDTIDTTGTTSANKVSENYLSGANVVFILTGYISPFA
jgi:hypothetical protein